MILDITHTNREHKEIIKDLVGRHFSFIKALKLRGIASKKMKIYDVSPNFKNYINHNNDSSFVYIELRPFGIIIKTDNGIKNFVWIISYHQLVIYKTNGISIHAQGRFIRFGNKVEEENKAFFDKLLDQRVKYKLQHNFSSD